MSILFSSITSCFYMGTSNGNVNETPKVLMFFGTWHMHPPVIWSLDDMNLKSISPIQYHPMPNSSPLVPSLVFFHSIPSFISSHFIVSHPTLSLSSYPTLFHVIHPIRFISSHLLSHSSKCQPNSSLSHHIPSNLSSRLITYYAILYYILFYPHSILSRPFPSSHPSHLISSHAFPSHPSHINSFAPYPPFHPFLSHSIAIPIPLHFHS